MEELRVEETDRKPQKQTIGSLPGYIMDQPPHREFVSKQMLAILMTRIVIPLFTFNWLRQMQNIMRLNAKIYWFSVPALMAPERLHCLSASPQTNFSDTGVRSRTDFDLFCLQRMSYCALFHWES